MLVELKTTGLKMRGECAMLSYMKKTTILVFLLCLLNLSSFAHAMSYDEERKISQEIITSLDANGLIIYDDEITWPIKMITDRLADHIKSPVYTFNVHVINDRSVNAFTIPDGHIFINIGTLLFAQDLDEIAAVIGHEMGHAQLRHIPQSLQEQKNVTAATIVGVVLGTILSSKNPEAGAAIIFSSLGGGENFKLSYSRSHEHDADDFGTRIIGESGFASSAMNRFLARLGAYSGGSSIPEYLLTHPYSTNRISGQSPDTQGPPHPESHYWTLLASVSGLILQEDEAVQRAQSFPEPYRKLALGIMETKKGRHDKAIKLLEKVDLPQAYAYKGLNLALLGKKDEAYPYLKQFGKSARAQIILADIMEGRGEFDQAVKLLIPYQKQSPEVDYKLGILHQKSSHETLSHVSFARYFFKTGKRKASSYHIDKALVHEKDLDGGIVEELKEMKKYIDKIEQK